MLEVERRRKRPLDIKQRSTAVQFVRQGESTADIKMLKDGLQYAG